jgi:hypothetical protein
MNRQKERENTQAASAQGRKHGNSRRAAPPGHGTPHRRTTHSQTPQEFSAAVRFLDGRHEIYHVRRADDAADARQIVLDQLWEVASVLVSPRRHPIPD